MTEETDNSSDKSINFDLKNVDFKDNQVNELVIKGLKSFYLTEYDQAVDILSQACEVFVNKFNQEDPMLLYYYGNALYRLAVNTSDVLGAEQQNPLDQTSSNDESQEKQKGKNHLFNFSETYTEDGKGEGEKEEKVEEKESQLRGEEGGNGGETVGQTEEETKEQTKDNGDKDNGDEDNGDKSDGDEDEEDEQSDFETAWQVLDLARTLFIKKIVEIEAKIKDDRAESDGGRPDDEPELNGDQSEAKHDDPQSNDQPQSDQSQSKALPSSNPSIETLNQLKIKLADTYDLLGEVSLESENFDQAVQDLGSALDLKRKLYPKYSNLVSEAHFKLSLAHELDSDSPNHMDKAIHHLEKTIECVDQNQQSKDIKGNSAIVNDLNIKLDELKQAKTAHDEEKTKVIQGILGANATNKEDVLKTLTNQANDISGLIKKRKAESSESSKKQAKN